MKLIMRIYLLLFCVFSVNAQQWNKLIDTDQPNFFDIQKAFYDYWKPYNVVSGKYFENGVEKKAYGWKQFKRWEWYWQSRIYENGQMPRPDINQIELKNYLSLNPEQSQANVLSPSWNPRGPSATTTFNGYEGVGRVNCIAFHPTQFNTFWIGSAGGGLWKTTDFGASWNVLTDNLPVLGISDIVVDYSNPNIIYIASGDDNGNLAKKYLNSSFINTNSLGVLKSIDGGITWASTSLNFSSNQAKEIASLVIDPLNPQILLAGTNNGIYRTANGGGSWTLVFSSKYVYDIEFKPGNHNYIYATATLNNEKTYVLRSTDNGVNWSVVHELCDDYCRAEIAVTSNWGDFLQVAVARQDLEKIDFSNNSGDPTSWNNSFALSPNGSNNLLNNNPFNPQNGGQGWYDFAHEINPVNWQEMWIGGVCSWKTIDGGGSWVLNNYWHPTIGVPSGFNVPPVVHADKHFYAYHPLDPTGNTFFECNDGGIYYTTNGGGTWNNISDGLDIGQIYRIATSSTVNDKAIIGMQDNGNKRLSNNLWDDTSIPGGDGMECIIDYTNSSIQYASYCYGIIYRTIDDWATNTTIVNNTNMVGTVNGPGAWVTPYVINPDNHNSLVVGKFKVHETNDMGDTWNEISPVFDSSSIIISIAYAQTNSQIIYVATQPIPEIQAAVSVASKVYKTTDGGNNWSYLGTSSNSDYVTSIAVDQNNPHKIWVTKSGYTANDKVWEYDGFNWINISGTLPNVPVSSIVYENNSSDALYIATDLGVFYRNGNMNDWVKLDNGLPNVVVTELEISYNNNKLWAGTFGRGLWECNLVVGGCTDPLACNYNPQASIDDNSCSYLNVTTSSNSVSCFGGNDATATVNVNGGSGGYVYSWSPGGQNTPTATNLTAGTYSCLVTDANGCSVSSGNILISQPLYPLTINSSSVSVSCFGGNDASATVNANGGSGGYVYSWSPGGQNTSTATSLTAGVYNCMVTDANGCNQAVNISVTQPSMLNVSISQSSSNLLSVFSGGISPYTFTWNGPFGFSSTNQNITPQVNGQYIVNIFDYNGCVATSNYFTVNWITTDISQIDLLDLKISPNPSKNLFNITFTVEKNSDIRLRIFNVVGDEIFSNYLIDFSGDYNTNINLQDYSRGVYFLEVSTSKGIVNKKLILH